MKKLFILIVSLLGFFNYSYALNTYAVLDSTNKGSCIDLSVNPAYPSLGNLIARMHTGGGCDGTWAVARSNIGKTTGKWYWEFKVQGGAYGFFNEMTGVGYSTTNLNSYLGVDPNGWGFFSSTGELVHSGVNNAFASQYYQNDVIGFALDADSGSVQVFVNGGAVGSYSVTTGFSIIPQLSLGWKDVFIEANFGQYPFQYSAPIGYNLGVYENGVSPTYFSYPTQVVPASLYSSVDLQVQPTSTSTYYMSSPIAPSSKGAGIVFLAHYASNTPVITWNNATMTQLVDTPALGIYDLDLFYISNPTTTSSIIKVSSVSTSSIRYITASTYSNANLVASPLGYNVSSGNKIKAYLTLTNFNLPTGYASSSGPMLPVGAFFASTTNPLMATSSFVGTTQVVKDAVLASSTVRYYFSEIMAQSCPFGIDGCRLGYVYNYFDSKNNGLVVGALLYSTSTTSTSATSSNNSSSASIFSEFSDFGECSVFGSILRLNLIDGTACLIQHSVYFVYSLFVLQPEDLVSMNNTFLTAVQNDQFLTSGFGFFYHLKYLTELSGTSYANSYGITIPTSISGGTFATSTYQIRVDSAYSISSVWDSRFALWLNSFFAVFALFLFMRLSLQLLL